ncbi:hypothetical protein [Paenarthrobacter sp. PH39-S1]|uniref:hypothetical protein n=1 Tax=Paenarthrobacter sp. PH39-S1 TaxID=3046204 RepID=UPI0024B97CB1|nr:hypothetical protein [Paenarthrobacter sp. PH39-S1]MDJ0357678.1 hypothetical protein [Paenarthrobacter sp. PH39-S1]
MTTSVQTPLSAAQKLLMQHADHNQIVSALSRIKVTTDASWLSNSNPYSADAQKQLKSDNFAVPSSQEDAFAEYLAAGAFVHCGDAWGYLGRAVDALVRGDLATAVHLTYYAELRGAISLLASEGIYVGNGYNCVVTATGQIEDVSKEGTHLAVWKLLDAWNTSARSSQVMGKVLRPGGVELDSWVNALPGGALRPIVDDLLSSIAFDLQSFSADRTRRNTASYNPTRLVAEDLSTSDMCRVVSHFWTTLEPDVRGGFPVLDHALLRRILTSNFSSINEVHDAAGQPTGQIDWSGWEPWLKMATPTQSVSTALYEQLKTDPTATQIDETLAAAFRNDAASTAPGDFIESMFARTTVLLRLSTGMCIRLLEDSGIDMDAIEPWIDSLGLSRGLWSPSEVPESKLDLWVDTEIALELLDTVTNSDAHGVIDQLRAHTVILGQTERVVAWSFA